MESPHRYMSPQQPLRPASAPVPSAPRPASDAEPSLMSMTLLLALAASPPSPAPAPPLAPPAAPGAPGATVPGRAVARSVNSCLTAWPVLAEHSRNMTPSLRALRRPSSLLTTLQGKGGTEACGSSGRESRGGYRGGWASELRQDAAEAGSRPQCEPPLAVTAAAPARAPVAHQHGYLVHASVPHLRSARSVLLPTRAMRTSVPRSARTSSSHRDASSKEAREVTS